MRHAVFGQKLSRDINARKALLTNLASSVLEKGEIKTTLAKAKFAQREVEHFITWSKRNRLNRNRKLNSMLSKKAFLKLINEIGPGFQERNGGYTRIIKIENRVGDSAPMAKLSLLKYEKTTKEANAKKVAKPVKSPNIKKTNKKTK